MDKFEETVQHMLSSSGGSAGALGASSEARATVLLAVAEMEKAKALGRLATAAAMFVELVGKEISKE